ncbi:hypothetical protein MSAR_30150 [Mycolicibacterium sarraceniae]|uniref:MspA protein n=1 Tax=Mycolicibacterium sarraceniae TaxID=1534348 RepID=A0A7I7SUL7_9MYCO|nr:hypothetical protein MSAR_30150 [Mycolicibacterium sarraceniae]
MLVALVGTVLATPIPASADPDPGGPELAQPVAADPAAPPVDDGKVMSSPPAATKSPDGWTLTISAKDEIQMPSAPLTTAISSREYIVSGVFNGALDGPSDVPRGVFEVGYQIGCGIDMSTSNGVALTGTVGGNASLGYFGLDFSNTMADGLTPGIGGNVGGGITVGLKPGIINIPVTKKEYKGDRPWLSISNFHVKIDGCVGESFIRSYATLSKSTDEGDAILSWYGVTKKI